MNDKTLTTMIKALQGAGFRLTPQRKAICRFLAESDQHPSAQMIYDQLRPDYETLSLATVYNTLEALSRLGLVNVLGEIGDHAAVRYDADTGPHVNLACIRCGRIIDIPSQHVHALDLEVEQTSGYALLGARVLYYGLCPECQAEDHGGSSAV